MLLLFLIIITILPTVSSIFDCTFDDDSCGWNSQPPWRLENQTLLPCVLNLAPRVFTGDGRFMLAQGHFGISNSGDLSSPLLPISNQMSLLSFRHSVPTGNAHLTVFLDDGVSQRRLDSVNAEPIGGWRERNVLVPVSEQSYKIIFHVEGIRNGFDSVAVDSVRLEDTSLVMAARQKDRKPEISINTVSRDIRRSPARHRSMFSDRKDDYCSMVKCGFENTTCMWSYNNWNRLDKKIVTNSQGDCLLYSEPLHIPKDAFFQMDIFSSEGSSTNVAIKCGTEENVIWSQVGIPHTGWQHISMPTKFCPVPSSIRILSNTPAGAFVAVTNTNLVDSDGKEMSCGPNLPAIRPLNKDNDKVIRLTALQKVDSTLSQSTNAISPVVLSPSSTNLLTPPTSNLPIGNSNGNLHIAPPTSPFAALPISPSQVSHLPMPKPPRSPAPAPPLHPIDHKAPLSSFVAPPSKESSSPPPPSPFAPPPSEISSNTISSISTAQSPAPALQQLLSRFAGQPVLENQFKFLAKKFGLDRMSPAEAEKSLEGFKRLLAGVKQNPVTIPGLKAILPVNLEPPHLNNLFASNLAQMLSPPPSHGQDSRPFSRQNLDFIIENAYNGYLKQSQT